jgi:hypothetical protein
MPEEFKRTYMLENDSAKFIEIRALTDPGLRDAIGGVCIHWALLELTVERVLANLTGERGLLRYEKPLRENLERVELVAGTSTALTEVQKKDVLGLIADVRAISIERHRIAHGLWGKDVNGVVHSVFAAISRTVPLAKEVKVEDIRQLKLAIILLGKKLRTYVDPSDQVQIRWEKD